MASTGFLHDCDCDNGWTRPLRSGRSLVTLHMFSRRRSTQTNTGLSRSLFLPLGRQLSSSTTNLNIFCAGPHSPISFRFLCFEHALTAGSKQSRAKQLPDSAALIRQPRCKFRARQLRSALRFCKRGPVDYFAGGGSIVSSPRLRA